MKDITLNTLSAMSVIHCGNGAFEKYARKYRDGHTVIVTDINVYALYGKLISDTFGENCNKIVIAAGEESKNPQVLLSILQQMLDLGMRRNCTVIALGGGVVGDIAGLSASLYMRGVRLVQIPTTLLAQVDSSVGGKTAVDMNGVKNVIGSFYQPEEVIVDPLFFSTLPEREINCGLGEIVKYGALNKDIYFKLLENIGNLKSFRFLGDITYDCILHKATVVTEDEHDLNGTRKTLNLGHTTGHAFELCFGEKSHGENVLIGMYYELTIARKFGICGGQYADNVKKLVLSVLGEIPAYNDIEKAAELAIHDKKNDDDNISLIVPKCEGECAEIKLSLSQYKKLLKECAESL